MNLVPIVGLVALLAFAARPAHAQEQSPSGSLTYVCSPDAVPTGIDSVLDCTFTALNEGDTAITRPRLNFAPSGAVSPPDRYYFFSYDLDGTAKEPGPAAASLTFDFNPIAPGEASEMRLRVIVRATREFGADVQLLGGEYEPVLDRGTLSLDVGATPPAISFTIDSQELATDLARDDGGQEAAFNLTFDNPSGDTTVDVELNTGYRYVAGGVVAWNEVLVDNARSGWRHYRAPLDVVNGRTGYSLMLSSAAGICLQAMPAVIATAHLDTGDVVVAALGEAPANCDGSGINVDAAGLPAGGAGPGQHSRAPAPWIAVLGASGAALVIAGGAIRRRATYQ